jgi:ERCC4-related helicase
VVVPLSAQIIQVRELALRILKEPITKLFDLKVFYTPDPEKVSRFGLIKARDTMSGGHVLSENGIKMMALGHFGWAISMCSALEVLTSHGLLSFEQRIKTINEEALKGTAKMRKDVVTK